eukprot:SM000005S17089  [mRNA]  locus=s5:21360:22260:+ [translate_table: standard]
MMVLGLDISTAFNTVERSVMEELRDHFPSLIPFFHMAYGRPGRLLSQAGESWKMLWGIPFAQSFCLGTLPGYTAHPEPTPDLLFPSYADDAHIIGPRSEVCPTKNVAWSPRGLPTNLQLPHGCQTPANGLAILKVPLGTSAPVVEDLRERLPKHLAPLPSLSLLGDTQLALAILTRCISQRACYLQRTVAPMGMVGELYKEYDNSLLQTLAFLLQFFPSASSSLQASLPTRMGGLGCRLLEQTAQAASLGCWHQIPSLLPMRFPCLADPVRNVE